MSRVALALVSTKLLRIAYVLFIFFSVSLDTKSQNIPVGQVVEPPLFIDFKSGKERCLDEFSGSVVVVEFFSATCPSSIIANTSTAFLARSYRSWGGNRFGVPVVFLHACVDQTDGPTASSFIKNNELKEVADESGGSNGRNLWHTFSSVQFTPYIVVLNGAENVPGHQQWEVLYRENYGSIYELEIAIDSVAVAADRLVLLSSPADRQTGEGTLAELKVVATSPLDLEYQWFKDGMPLPGATSEVLRIRQARLSDSGLYMVQVRDAEGVVESRPARLRILSQTPLDLPDPLLVQALSEALGAPPSPANLLQLRALDLTSRGITSLSGLEQAIHLSSLHAASNQIQDLSALAGLSRLTNLSLSANPLTSIQPLAGLTNLLELNLQHTRIVDVSPLTNSTKLSLLTLDGVPATDASFAGSLTNLFMLSIRDTRMTNWSALNGCATLSRLIADRTRSDDWNWVGSLRGLTDLSLQQANLSDLSMVRPLKGLRTLDVSGNRLGSLDGIQTCTNLWYLSAYANQLTNITALRGSACFIIDARVNRLDLSPGSETSGIIAEFQSPRWLLYLPQGLFLDWAKSTEGCLLSARVIPEELVQVYSSTDLVHWELQFTTNVSGGDFRYAFPTSDGPRRFYRVEAR